jgi:hypothetical protein
MGWSRSRCIPVMKVVRNARPRKGSRYRGYLWNRISLMAEEPHKQALREHRQYLDERKQLIDAARESARTFDKAVLTFGAAVFGASIAFIKDVAPKPEAYTLKWLAVSWGLFSVGLLAIILSFLFAHQACMFEIDVGTEALGKEDFRRPKNRWSTATDCANILCVAFLFLGLLSWSVFAFENLMASGGTMPNNPPSPSQQEPAKKSYTPPRTPAPPPPTQSVPAPPSQSPPSQK